jgi:hypothetical protein
VRPGLELEVARLDDAKAHGATLPGGKPGGAFARMTGRQVQNRRETRMKKLAALGLAFALVAIGVASAAPHATHNLRATLNGGQEVPKQTFKVAGATGTFTATMTNQGKITWKLSYKSTSGPVMAAHIHLARVGVSGPVVVPLCGPCHSGQTGTGTATAAQVKAILSHGAYVNIHTAKNPAGEIRGQLTSS